MDTSAASGRPFLSALRDRLRLLPTGRASASAFAIDVAIAAGVAAIGLSQSLHLFERRPPEQEETWQLVLLAAGALLVRSRWPLAALAGATFAGGWFLLLGNRGALAVLPAVLVAQYTVVARGEPSRGASIAFAIVAAAALAVAAQIGDPYRPTSSWAMDAGWITAAILLGDAMRSRRELATEAEARAEQAERTRDEEARRRVTEERLAIARELHDVVAHTIALINVQAGVAAHVFDRNPEQAREAFEHIRSATHETLNELRAMVGVLREDGTAPLEPTRGLDGLDALVAQVREAGLDVALERSGDLAGLPAHVGVAAYRVLQEALTNVLRHNGASRVTVGLRRTETTLELRVTNERGPLRQPGPFVPGHGLTGMGERVEAIGGTLAAGPLPDGGFEVRASFPLDGPTP